MSIKKGPAGYFRLAQFMLIFSCACDTIYSKVVIIMYCQYCGAEIPEGAKFCLECGGPTEIQAETNANSYGSLRICRDKALMAADVRTKVFVDGELKTTIDNGDASSFLLLPGVHEVRLNTPLYSNIVQDVTIQPGIETVLHFKLTMVSDSRKITGIHDTPMIGQAMTRSGQAAADVSGPVRKCPRCGGTMAIQTVSESRKAGCGTFILYLLLALTVLGLLIVIPLLLRKKTETVTYAVCQNCGYQKIISRR